MPKGVYKKTEKHKRKISKTMKGRMPKFLPNNKGKKRTEEQKRKMSERMKGKKYVLGKHWKLSEETKRKMRKKHNISEETRKKMSELHSGEKAYNWKGGQKPYKHQNTLKQYKEWRSKVFERDNWTCQTCGKRSQIGEKVYLEPHHIKGWTKYPELRYDVNNGITLCKDCHNLTKKRK